MNTPIDISNVTLKTERLTLRPWRQSDLEDFFEYASVDGVGQMAGWLPHASIEKSREILNIFIEGRKTFAIELDGKAIGSLGIEKYDEEQLPELAPYKCRELGFVLSKAYWGKGYMPEAVNRVILWLFDEVGLDAITCGYFKHNSQSARVQEKCGFRKLREGTFNTRMGTVEETVMNILWKSSAII